MSLFWKEFFRVQKTGLYRSTAYHPQSDGKMEVVNKTLESYLCCFINGKPKGWAQLLPWAEYWYNTSTHASTKHSPFEIVYGRSPIHLVHFTSSETAMTFLEEQLIERDVVMDDLKAHLLSSQQRMKILEDSHRRNIQFQAGKLEFLKLQPYRQTFIAGRLNKKLSPRLYDPFHVSKWIGQVAYRLALPPTARIHNVFHISQLKKAVGSAPVTPDIPTHIISELVFAAELESVLQVRNPIKG